MVMLLCLYPCSSNAPIKNHNYSLIITLVTRHFLPSTYETEKGRKYLKQGHIRRPPKRLDKAAYLFLYTRYDTVNAFSLTTISPLCDTARSQRAHGPGDEVRVGMPRQDDKIQR
jgi:hypothetical protein